MKDMWSRGEREQYLSLDSIISEAQVLQVCGGVGLHRGELVLQHMNDLRQLGVTPGKLPGTQTERYQTHTRARAETQTKQYNISTQQLSTHCPQGWGTRLYVSSPGNDIDNYYIAGLLLFSQYKRMRFHFGFICKTRRHVLPFGESLR